MPTNTSPGPTGSAFLMEHLAAAAGSYLPNQAIIRLDRNASLLMNEGAADNVKYAVFIHEYLHYLHNYSTVTGVSDFLAFVSCLNLFVGTVDRMGQSHGGQVLTMEQRRTYAALTDWRKYLAGDVTAPFDAQLHRTDVRFEVEDIVERQSQTTLWNSPVDLYHVEIRCRVSSASAPPQSATVRVGSRILMESLAWEVEQMLYAESGTDSTTMEPSTFPYKLGRVLFEQISNRCLSNEAMARILLIALQTAHPGDSFVTAARRFKESTNDASDVRILERLKHDLSGVVRATAENIRNNLIDAVTAPWVDRGAAGRGIKTMAGWCKDLLRERQERPYFELDAVSVTSGFQAFTDLIQAYPPCPIIQSADENGEVEIVIMRNPGIDPNDLGATQGLFQFANSHFTETEILSTSTAKKGQCRFWGACKVGFALTSGEACRVRPWESFHSDRNAGCWYSQGMLEARGLPDLP